MRGLSFDVLSLRALGQIKWSTVRSAIMIDLWNYDVLSLQAVGYISGGGVQFSLAPSPIGSSGGHKGRFSRDPLPVFSAGGLREQFWYGLGCSLFDVVHSVIPLPTTASPTLQGALKDGFGGAVVACEMSELCKFPSLDSCRKRFLWTHKGR